MSETAIFPWFWPLPSTKSRFLCAFSLRNPRFRAFRAQNRHFCALFAFETPIFGLFEHKIEVFVRFCQQVFPDYGFYGLTASSIFPMAIRHSAPACFFPMAIRLSAASLFASAPWPATNLIRRRKVLRFGYQSDAPGPDLLTRSFGVRPFIAPIHISARLPCCLLGAAART